MSEVIATDATFEKEVLQASEPVLVDFWAPWCGPCRIIGPIVEKLAGEFAGKVKVAKLNVDENPVTAQKYGVMSIPTLIIYKGGQAVEQMVGVQQEAALREKLAAFG
ncbi:thioredoxin [Patescibacteria group bacterium]|nr:MAG: thioredoxin [Patescibacteria group bacterium]